MDGSTWKIFIGPILDIKTTKEKKKIRLRLSFQVTNNLSSASKSADSPLNLTHTSYASLSLARKMIECGWLIDLLYYQIKNRLY